MNPQSTPSQLPETPLPFIPNIPPLPLKPETVQLVIDNLQKQTGVFSKQTWRMLVTDVRLIFIMQVKNNVDYIRQDPNLSLAENPNNFAVPLEELQIIEIYRGDFDSNSTDSMLVKTLSDKLTFLIKDAYRTGQNLKKIVGNKVK